MTIGAKDLVVKNNYGSCQSWFKTYLTENIAREMSKEAKEMMDKYMLRLAKILLLTAELLVVFWKKIKSSKKNSTILIFFEVRSDDTQ